MPQEADLYFVAFSAGCRSFGWRADNKKRAAQDQEAISVPLIPSNAEEQTMLDLGIWWIIFELRFGQTKGGGLR